MVVLTPYCLEWLNIYRYILGVENCLSQPWCVSQITKRSGLAFRDRYRSEIQRDQTVCLGLSQARHHPGQGHYVPLSRQ